MARQYYVRNHIRLALHMDYFMTVLRLFPSIWRQILSSGVEGLNVDVLDRGSEIGESPRNSLVVADDHVGITR